MKIKMLVFVLVLILIFPSLPPVGFHNQTKIEVADAANSTYAHSIAIDGNQDFYDSVNGQRYQNETFSTSLSGVYSYLTWDATNIYFAYQSDDVRSSVENAGNKWVWLYIGGPGGTYEGLDYAGQKPKFTFAAKYHIRFKVDGTYTNRQMWNGTSWQDMGNYSWGTNIARNDSKKYVEFKFPRAHFGLDTSNRLQMVSAIVYEDQFGTGDAMWAAMPYHSFGTSGNGYDRDFETFYDFDVSASNASASQAYQYQLAVSKQSLNSVDLSFVSSEGATAVQLQQSTNGGFTWGNAETTTPLSATSTFATVKQLQAGQSYVFRLIVTGGTNAGQSLAVPVKTSATAYRHAITLDGVNDFYTNSKIAANETFSTSSPNVYQFVTWDEEFLYLGFHAPDITSTTANAVNKWIWLYFGPSDTTTGSGTGSVSGLNYSGQQPQLPFAATHHIRFRMDGGYTNRQMWTGLSWQDMGNYHWGTHVARNDSLQFLEMRIARADLGIENLRSFRMVSALITEDKTGDSDTMIAAFPADAFGSSASGYDLDFANYYEFDFQSPLAAASQYYNYELRVVGKTSSTVNLKFLAQNGASSVKIEQSVDGGSTWNSAVLSSPLSNTSTAATVTGLNPQTQYLFRLTTSGLFSNGGWTTDTTESTPITSAPLITPTAPGQWIADVYTDKARYHPGSTVQVSVDLVNPRLASVTGKLQVIVAYMESQITSFQSTNITLPAATANQVSRQTVTVPITAPPADFRGYRVDVYWQENGAGATGILDYRSGAFDVSSDWKKFPRYGYITDYPNMTEQQVADVIKRLNRYHINALQYYDWQWTHHVPVKMENGQPATVWKDIANRDVYSETIRKYIAAAKHHNMLNMNYNLMFGSYVGAVVDGVLPQWGLYKDKFRQTQDAHPLPSSWATDRILIQNPANDDWVQYILQTEKAALDLFGFDGWHIDQLGDRGTLYDYNGNEVKFDDAYGSMLHKIKAGLNTRMVMNAVSEYGVGQIAGAPVDVLYTEVWPMNNDKSYSQLKRYVETGLNLGQGKRGQVLAAYMNYQAAEQPGYFNTPAVLLTDAVIMAAGGTHLELGDTGMLGKEYFPNKNLQVSPELDQRLKRYYDFQTAYQNLLMDGVQPLDVPVTAISGATVTSQPQAGAVWSFARQADGAQTIHFINLSNNITTDWRDDFANNVTMPTKKTNVKVQIKSGVRPEQVFFTTADGDHRFQLLTPTITTSSDGKYTIELTLPELTLWSTVVLKQGGVKIGSSTIVKASTDVAPSADTVPPSVPSGLVSSNITTSGFKVSWKASTDNLAVAAYNVYLNNDYFKTVTIPTITFTGLLPGRSYSVKVMAYDAAKNKSAQSAALQVSTRPSGVDTIAPSVPVNLMSSNLSSSSFKVSWSASSDNLAVSAYNIYLNGIYNKTVSIPTVTFSGLVAGTTYAVSVLAYDAAKNKSAQSTVLQVKTLTAGTVVDLTAPSVPSGLVSGGVGSTSFTVTWTASTDHVGVTGYNVYLNGIYYKSVAAPSVQVTGRAPNTNYSITVLAYDAAKNRSAQSTAISVKTLQ